MTEPLPDVLRRYPKLSSWLRLETDGTVTAFTGKVELGQGIGTALAQLVAEELELPLSAVRWGALKTGHTPDEGYTAGSASLETSGRALQLVAAQLAASLRRVAAARHGLSPDAVALRDGQARHAGTDAPLGSYAELAPALDPEETFSGEVAPKAPVAYRLVGTAAPRADLPAKVTGAARYLHDLELPDLLHARVLRAPRYGAPLVSLETAAVEALPGIVRVVRRGAFAGLVAEGEWAALRGLACLEAGASWGRVELPDTDALPGIPDDPETVVVREGAPEVAGLERLEARYEVPYQAHASVAPSCAVARFDGGHLTVWTHSQGVYPLRRELARLLAMNEDDLTLVHQEGPGCYGHNGADDAAADAALLALAVPGRPVRLRYSLAQELCGEPYGPAMALELAAGLDRNGRVAAWTFDGLTDAHTGRPGGQGDRLRAAWETANTPPPWSGPSEGGYRNAETLYTLGAARVRTHFVRGPLRTSALRTLGAFANTFANESFMDELAYLAGRDPVAFRLEHLRDERARRVLETAAECSGWTPHTAPSGRGFGVALARYKNVKAYVAQVVVLELDPDTLILRVVRVVTVCDAGRVVNPDGLVNQLEGGTLQGLSRGLKEAVRYDRAGQGMADWYAYPVLGFRDLPEVETVLLDRPELPSLGAGEAATPPVGAALANALFDGAGLRLRRLPLTPERVREGLEALTETERVQLLIDLV